MPNNTNLENTAVLATSTSAPSPQPIDETLQLAQAIVQAADDRKGADITLLNVSEVSPLADYFLIVTGFSKVQVRAIARSIEEKVETEFQRRPRHMEGLADGTWVLQDYGDVIVHIQLPQEREFYNLEAFWGHAERVNVVELVHQLHQ